MLLKLIINNKNNKKGVLFLKPSEPLPKYTFDNFVVGPNNKFAYDACLAVAKAPGKAYNPLFLYSGPGLGKTHLLNAIGNYIKQHLKGKKVIYVPSEDFTNELIDALHFRMLREFRAKYRKVDVLLLDDIEFLAGKESTQEEFFHTFNELYNAGKQIIITSDRPPYELSVLMERLRSRFEAGLITDIQPPRFETRLAILRKIAERENLELSDDVIYLIGSKITRSVRSLEGCIVRLAAYTRLTGDSNLTLDKVESLLREILVAEQISPPLPPPPSPQQLPRREISAEERLLEQRKQPTEIFTKLEKKLSAIASKQKSLLEPETLKFEPGYSYLIKEPDASFSYHHFRTVAEHVGGLCLTPKFPDKVKVERGLTSNVIIKWLSMTEVRDALNPSRLEFEILDAIKNFISKVPQSIVFIESIEILVQVNSFGSVLNFLKTVSDMIAPTKCILLVSLNPQTLTPLEVTRIEKCFDVIKDYTITAST